jgi:alcohol dehydrogenase class IV
MFWTIQKAAFRLKHTTMKYGAPILMKFDDPELLTGAGCVNSLADVLEKAGISQALLVTDGFIMDLGLTKGLMDSLEKTGIGCTVYDAVQSNPAKCG